MHLSSRLLSSCYLSLRLSVLVSVYLWSKAACSCCSEHTFCLFAHLLANLMHPQSCCLPVILHIITGFPYILFLCQHGLSLCSLWILYTDRWLEDILGSKLVICCRERPLLPTSKHMTVAFKTHTLSARTHIHYTYTLAGMHKNEVPGSSHWIGEGRG